MTRWDATNRQRKVKRESGRGWIDSRLRRADKEMSKAEMQRQLAEAVRNTAAMPVDDGEAS
jgi:hypothetical protein